MANINLINFHVVYFITWRMAWRICVSIRSDASCNSNLAPNSKCTVNFAFPSQFLVDKWHKQCYTDQCK